MKEYKMKRGEYLEDRMPNLKESIEEYFGSVTGTEIVEGQELYVVEDPDNPVFDRILIGEAQYEDKKDKLAVHFEERPVDEVVAEGHTDAAADALEKKNEFLLEATGRDAKARRESMKRAVEDESPDI
ncbi:MAG: DUF5611 family protein [Halobacteriaceae archaeon]